MTKYYLIKNPECIRVSNENDIVELTEEEVKAIANEKKHLTSSSDYINGCDKLRKVLK